MKPMGQGTMLADVRNAAAAPFARQAGRDACDDSRTAPGTGAAEPDRRLKRAGA